ncbi:hypothetical protein EJ05DRAFT_41618 [Pseudovirgaria hyperparasitica]|uniref:Uncharacterized protein n=1 Tax=Pseudovirgaria hyperparasitica TaxID=470096 RepID=A0A6A6WN02_9PEZI|nr:uncharacterized protein EJ05DRAFT_41618 [Pseudovirgaria hyperparasitica]KAF2763503.1 hypothetical protein EJ05DRAFT_41618 [Pseudovirgaria hyperparasitica]
MENAVRRVISLVLDCFGAYAFYKDRRRHHRQDRAEEKNRRQVAVYELPVVPYVLPCPPSKVFTPVRPLRTSRRQGYAPPVAGSKAGEKTAPRATHVDMILPQITELFDLSSSCSGSDGVCGGSSSGDSSEPGSSSSDGESPRRGQNRSKMTRSADVSSRNGKRKADDDVYQCHAQGTRPVPQRRATMPAMLERENIPRLSASRRLLPAPKAVRFRDSPERDSPEEHPRNMGRMRQSSLAMGRLPRMIPRGKMTPISRNTMRRPVYTGRA